MSNSQVPQTVSYRLTTKNLFKHFLLVHDFLYKFTKTKAVDGQFLDAQIDVQGIMVSGTDRGGKFGQLLTFGALVVYCLKSYNIPLKIFSGFLYVYWINHTYTLGQYLGALVVMPQAYRKVGNYFEKYNSKHPNLLDTFEKVMEEQQQVLDTHQCLKKIFPEEQNNENDYLQNSYFAKNREKYSLPSESSNSFNNMKLQYLDSFLTRYIYYSFSRWFHRVKLFLGVQME